METLETVGFTGALITVPLAIVACISIGGTRHPRWVSAVAFALSGVTACAFVVYGVTWGLAFDYVDRYENVPASIEVTSTAAVTSCFVSSLAVAALGLYRLTLAVLPATRPRSAHSWGIRLGR
ncbi:hypothetical protein [Nocardioides marmoraquaticus]